MKKFLSGVLIGTGLMLCTFVFADEGLTKIEAYLRPGLPITLDGKKMTLEAPPVMVDGSTYLKLRDVAKLTGLGVEWNEATQTVELSTNPAESSEPQPKPSFNPVKYQYGEIHGIETVITNNVTFIRFTTGLLDLYKNKGLETIMKWIPEDQLVYFEIGGIAFFVKTTNPNEYLIVDDKAFIRFDLFPKL